jgi:hypothetical protein
LVRYFRCHQKFVSEVSKRQPDKSEVSSRQPDMINDVFK